MRCATADDLVLNTVIASTTKKPTLRVLLPPGSIEDPYNSCYPTHRQLTGGLGLQGDRTVSLSETILSYVHNADIALYYRNCATSAWRTYSRNSQAHR